MKSASWAVVKTSGKPPASGQSRRVGHRHRAALVHHRELGLAAAAHDRHHAIALAKRAAPGPSATTSPASSSPGMSCGAPGGAG